MGPLSMLAKAACRLAAALPAVALLVMPCTASEVLIQIDKGSQRMTVAVDGQTRFTWPVSTGMAGYATPVGAYRPSRLARDHFSREWDDAPMPFSIFFTDAGHAIHGSQAVARLGSPASHGCVRLAPRHAGILFNLVSAEGLENTRIVIAGMEPIGTGLEGASGAGLNRRGLTSFDPLAVGIMAGSGDPRPKAARPETHARP